MHLCAATTLIDFGLKKQIKQKISFNNKKNSLKTE